MRIKICKTSARLGLDNVKTASRTLGCFPSAVSNNIEIFQATGVPHTMGKVVNLCRVINYSNSCARGHEHA